MTIPDNDTKQFCDKDLNDSIEVNMPDNSNISSENHLDMLTNEIENSSTNDSVHEDFFMYTNEMRVENNLLKLVTDMNIPNYAF